MQRKITAVVVTYNRLESLKKVFSALQSQSFPMAEIIVVDNKSTDGTSDYLSSTQSTSGKYPLFKISSEVNDGGAGGFHRGMKNAYERGADLIWLMDDDCIPNNDALEKLVRAYDYLENTRQISPGFVCSNVRWTDGSICEMNVPTARWDWSRYYTPEHPYCLTETCSFVSALITTAYLPKIGYPIKEFFIWYDDTEFTRRLAMHSASFIALDSHVIHELGDNIGVKFSQVTDKNLWKFKYGARNEATVLAAKPFGALRVAQLIVRILNEMNSGRAPMHLRLPLLKSALSGLFFNYRSKIIFPQERT